MKKILLAFITGLFFVFNHAVAQTADEIVNKYVQAIGGKEKLDNLKSIKLTCNIDIGPNMKAPVTIYAINNKAVRVEYEMQGMKLIQAMQGDSGWYINPFQGKKDPERMSEEQVRDAKDQADIIGSLYDYKSKGSTVENLGKQDMEGTDTYKLKVNRKTGDVEYYYLDAETYLPLKQTIKRKFKDKEISTDILFSNYKTIDGFTFAHTMEQRNEGSSQGQPMNIEKIEVNPTVDNELFKMPQASIIK